MKKRVQITYMLDEAMKKTSPFMAGVAQKLFEPYTNMCSNIKNTLVLHSAIINKTAKTERIWWI